MEAINEFLKKVNMSFFSIFLKLESSLRDFKDVAAPSLIFKGPF